MNLEYILSIAFAALPAIVWSAIFLSKRDQNARLYVLIFVGGTLTVPLLLKIHASYYWLISKVPALDFIGALDSATSGFMQAFLLYGFVGISEEVIKFMITLKSDKSHPELIRTLADSLKFGVLAGLGFAFAENIKYFYFTWTSQRDALLATIMFRSTFTVCAHLIFSAILAYYYGISKFADDLVAFKKLQGRRVRANENRLFRWKSLAMGLTLAMLLHAAFDLLLEYNQVIPVILLVSGMFAYLMFLLNRKTSNLAFILADKHRSVMNQRDIETCLEYIAMRFNEKKYQEVINISARLLSRDPDNNVVKLFVSKATDKLKKGV